MAVLELGPAMIGLLSCGVSAGFAERWAVPMGAQVTADHAPGLCPAASWAIERGSVWMNSPSESRFEFLLDYVSIRQGVLKDESEGKPNLIRYVIKAVRICVHEYRKPPQ